MQDLNKYVIEQFNSKVAQEYYIKKANSGLWNPEKILINKYFKKGKVLDIGCGTGRTTIPLFKQGFNVIGVDLASNMIKNAKSIAKKKKLNIKYCVQDAMNLKFKSNSFDSVLFSNNGWAQIPGKENRTKAIKEIHRVLKQNGCYIFTVQSRWLMLFNPTLLFSWFKSKEFGVSFFKSESGGALNYDKPQYVYLPSKKELTKELQEQGFKIELVKSFMIFKNLNLFFPVFYVCRKLN